MTLRALFGIHAIVTSAAGIVLVTAPRAIPGAVGIRVEPAAYLLCYLLAAAEFGVSVLSWGARGITDAAAVRLIVVTFIVLHAASGVLEIVAVAFGATDAVWVNVALRATAVLLFSQYGLGWPFISRSSVGR